jgi:hypothetical protein
MSVATTSHVVEVPKRGDRMPWLVGPTPEGTTLRTRDYYMRRNLALVFTGDGEHAQDWAAEAASMRPAARDEAGEIIVIAPPGVDVGITPDIIDHDGGIAARVGLSPSELPALFITDRYGTVFAASRGATAVDMRPSDIPGWLEFVACRCS